MTRVHFHRPLQDGNGTLLVGALIRILQPGTTTLVTETIYTGLTDSTSLSNPWTTGNGIANFYMDVPRTIRLGVTPSGGSEVFFEDLDVGAPGLATGLATKVTKGDLVLNVKDYGALGDGTTDDTAAINAVILAAPVGSTVLFPAGSTFMVNADYNAGFSILPKTGVNLRIDGTLQAITNAVDNSAVIRSRSITDYSITGSGSINGERLTHTGASTGQGGMCIRIEAGARIKISGISLSNAWGDGMYVSIYGATAGTESTDIAVSGVLFNNNRRNGLTVAGAVGVTISGCQFFNTNGTDPQAGIDLEPNSANIVRAVSITGNVFRNNAAKGVQVSSGTSDVSITGNVFDGAHTDSAIRLAGSDVVVADNTVRGGVMGVNAGLAPRLVIEGNRIAATTSYGIALQSNCGESTITGNTVLDAGADGIYIRGSLSFTCVGNVVSRCGGATGGGITTSYASTASGGNGVIASNVITDAANVGITVAVPNVLVNGNLIVGASAAATGVSFGIYVSASVAVNDCRIVNNVFRPGLAGQLVKYGVNLGSTATRTFVGDNDYAGILTSNYKDSGVLSRLGSTIYNVKDYGALGDGTTDDTAAIAAAVTAANIAGGGTVFFPRATYATKTSITVYSNVTLRGDRATILATATFTGTTMFTMSSRTNVRVEGLTIDGGTTIATTMLNFITCTGVTVQDCIFQNATNSGACGVRLNGGSTIKVSNCTFNTLTRGVHGSNNTTTWLSRVSVVKCYFTAMADAIVYVTGTDGSAASEDFTIDDCRGDAFRGSGTTRAGIYFVVSAGAVTKHKKVRILNTTLIGRSESFVSGTGNSDFITYYDCVDGSITDCEVAYGGDVGISLSRSDRNTITGCSSHDTHTFGISMWDSSHNTVVGNLAYNNRRNFDGVLAGTKAGILCRASTSVSNYNVIVANRCYDNQATKTQQYGVSIEAGCIGNVVVNNSLLGNLTGELLDAGTATVLPTAANVQVFNTSGTYTVPNGAKSVQMVAISGGGGGASGRRGAVSTVRCGGGGGAGGGVGRATYPASALTATIAITVGTGGAGGAAVATDDTNGNAGTAGSTTLIGTYLRTLAGGGGVGGTSALGTGGAASTTAMFLGAAGGAGSTTGLLGTAGVSSVSGGPGGGAGGGITVIDAISAGGVGGVSSGMSAGTGAATGGAAAGGNGANGSAPTATDAGQPGYAGGGGGSSITGAAGSGGNGTLGSGGGGGGASLNGNTSGAGGNGGPGVVLMVATF